MPLYSYAALEGDGKRRKGVIDADSFEAAKEKLYAQQIIVTNIALAKERKKFVLGASALLDFTRDVKELLRSGLPLYETLLTIEEKNRGQKQHFLYLDLCDQVKNGKKLSSALVQYSKTFDPVYISMVSAGENTGSLDQAFASLYKVIARNEKFRRQIRSASVYPAFLASFCLLILTGLFLFLIPAMKELLEGRRLHPMTQIIVATSDFLLKNWPFILTSLAGLGAFLLFFFRQERTRDGVKAFFLKVPLFKEIIVEAVFMRFCRVLAVLLGSGVPIVEALSLARSIMNHKSFERVVKQAEENLVKGERLSVELKKSPLFPPLVVRMLATSEEAGNTAEMLENVAEIYEDMLEKTLTQFTNLLQPVMLLVLGILVGVILLSVLLPLTDVSSLM